MFKEENRVRIVQRWGLPKSFRHFLYFCISFYVFLKQFKQIIVVLDQSALSETIQYLSITFLLNPLVFLTTNKVVQINFISIGWLIDSMHRYILWMFPELVQNKQVSPYCTIAISSKTVRHCPLIVLIELIEFNIIHYIAFTSHLQMNWKKRE